MDWLDRMNAALDYIEAELTGTVDLRRAAQITGCTPRYFTLMFGYVAGLPFVEYLRRRRLTLAALELVEGARVLDVALRYGYESPTAFSRAFAALHGITPSAARQPGARLKAFPRIRFQISIKGEAEMNYRIEQKEAFNIVGYKYFVPTADGENMRLIPTLWQNLTKEQWAALNGLIAGAGTGDGQPMGMLGVCADMHQMDSKDGFDYYIAAASGGAAPTDMAAKRIPASTWAIFECRGPMPATIQDVWKRIYAEWFPTSGYKHAETPDLEVYPEEDVGSADSYSEIWVPVVKA